MMIDQVPCDERKENWLTCLQASGYRLTSPRRAVVDTLANSQRALNAAEIYDLAREQYPSLGLVSVYRTLEKLEELELIQRVHHPDGCQAFIAGFTGHQHLLICQSCGQTAFFEGDDLEPLFERVAQESGYQIQEHWLQLFGYCAKCQE
jgi:Fe2+ or Zn2+ uptake regulation protein